MLIYAYFQYITSHNIKPHAMPKFFLSGEVQMKGEDGECYNRWWHWTSERSRCFLSQQRKPMKANNNVSAMRQTTISQKKCYNMSLCDEFKGCNCSDAQIEQLKHWNTHRPGNAEIAHPRLQWTTDRNQVDTTPLAFTLTGNRLPRWGTASFQTTKFW